MKRNVAALTQGVFDLVIVGGGITGAGVALDAALRGLRVALIDKGDFASGTSSVSSKLVHGGLRYLEHGGFHLVYEALHERALLLRNAMHLVRPLRFVLPFYEGTRVSPWKWRVGLTLYDLLAGAANICRSRPLTRRDVLRQYPGLHDTGLCGGAQFFDAQMDDARLCIEVLKSAVLQGACIANYVEAIGFVFLEGAIKGVCAIDHVSGAQLTIEARVVLNAAGPWVDAVCRLAQDYSGPHLQPTKGVHIICPGRGRPSSAIPLPNEQRGGDEAAFLLLHPRDGRVLFVIPWMGKTLIGTTDTFTPAGPDMLKVEPGEVAYLLDAHNHYFRPQLTNENVLGSFAGLRPLIRARPGQPSTLSREFRLFTSASGLLSAAGGKYTTYRKMAEEITDVVARRLGKKTRCRTQQFVLDGSPSEPWEQWCSDEVTRLQQRFQLSVAAAGHLAQRYGRRASAVAECVTRDPQGLEALCPGEPDLRGEIVYQREHEMALFPADHYLRRMRLGMFHALASFAPASVPGRELAAGPGKPKHPEALP